MGACCSAKRKESVPVVTPQVRKVTKRISEISDSELQLVFNQFDVNGDGYIEEPELKQVMTRLGQEPNDDEIRAMFKAADLNCDGKISYDEFVEIAQANPLSLSMKTVFGEMDRDGDGYVTRSEMEQALKRMGHNITESELNAIFKAADTDLDGQIDFEEFVAIMCHRK